MGILNLFERGNEPYIKLSLERTRQLFTHPSLRCFFITERSFPEDYHPLLPSSSVKLMTGEYDTGRFHFMIRIKLSEEITQISKEDRIITQEWELIEYLPDPNGKSIGVYHFKAWGKEPCEENDFEDNTHHENIDMYIDAVYFNQNVLSKIYGDTSFDKDRIRNTIGFEYLSFK